MIKLASQLMDQISKWVSENPTTATALLTGGAGALGGFALTSVDPEEDTAAAMKRRLKNALLVGGLSAGAGALGSEAIKAFSTAYPADPPKSTTQNVVEWGIDGAGGAAGGVATGVAARKLLHLRQKKYIIQAARSIKGDVKTLAEARDVLANAYKKGDIDALAKSLGKETTQVNSIVSRLKDWDIKPQTTNTKLRNAAKATNVWTKRGLWRVTKKGIIPALVGGAGAVIAARETDGLIKTITGSSPGSTSTNGIINFILGR